MRLSKNVKPKGFMLNLVPFVSKYSANAIYPNIYLKREVYENLMSRKPNKMNISILVHEKTHIRRQKKMGAIKWGLKYALFPRFRFTEEYEAIYEAMKYRKRYGLTWDTEKSARNLSGYLYLWCIDYETAKKKLDLAWYNIK